MSEKKVPQSSSAEMHSVETPSAERASSPENSAVDILRRGILGCFKIKISGKPRKDADTIERNFVLMVSAANLTDVYRKSGERLNKILARCKELDRADSEEGSYSITVERIYDDDGFFLERSGEHALFRTVDTRKPFERKNPRSK